MTACSDPFQTRASYRRFHRLQLLPRLNTIVLVHEGRAIDAGRLDELLARQPMFREMWRGYTSEASGDPSNRAA
ncbi:MAG: hypothetical protein JWO36_4088 [Myxococcales bacterium]|nr:hypothetical protein [Myxococcales bacterium]